MSKNPDPIENRILKLDLQTGSIGTTNYVSFSAVKKDYKVKEVFRETKDVLIMSVEIAKGKTIDVCFFRRILRHGSSDSREVDKAGY